MAILRGFPPSNTISPSVRITEKDLSFIAPQQSFHRAGLVGFASKGPINIPTVVRSSRELHTLFGQPHPESGDPYLLYAAEQYLMVSNELFIIRVADQSEVSDERAIAAEIDVPTAGGLIALQSDTAGPYVFATDSFFRWKLNGVLSSKTLVVLADSYSADELADALNSQLEENPSHGIRFTVNGGKIAVETTFAYGPTAELELVSVQDAIYGPDSVTGLGTGMTPGATTGTVDRYPNDGYHTAGTYDLTGLSDLNLQIVVDGTDNVLIDNRVQVIDLAALEGGSRTVAAIVTEINSQITDGTIPGGFVASATGNNLTLTTLHSGRDAKLLVKTSSSAAALFGFDGITARGGPIDTTGVSGASGSEAFAIVHGSPTSTTSSFTILADSPGIEGNNTQVVIKNNIRENNFTVEVYSNGVQVEAWGNLTKDQTSRYYVETFLATASDYIRVIDNTEVGAPPLGGTYNLSGGTDGIPTDPDAQDKLLIGNSTGFTGMFGLSEPEQIDIDLIAVPGHSSTTVVTALLDICMARGDALAIIDPPFGLTVNEITQWQNGTHPLNNARFDSDFGALYWPWVKVRDTFNGVDVWCPPSGSAMAVIARSDFLGAPWMAPAGTLRGIVPGITDVFSRPTLEERDLMQGFRNAINPIVQFSDGSNFMVWGQKTLQRTPTSLDRINVRRLMFAIEKRIRAESRTLLFEPHDEAFRERFVQIAEGILREVQVGRGISAFIVKADEELNTPDVIDRNEFRARIGIVPVKSVEYIFLEFSLHRTGSFSEGTDTF